MLDFEIPRKISNILQKISKIFPFSYI